MWDKHQIVEEPYDGKLSRTVLKPSWGSDAPAQVNYNYILKSFVLIDLKTTTITHQDVGQMDMYVRMYDERVRGEGDNPTIGIVLCSETDEDIARYSVLHDNDRLFASKYMLYMPTEEELREEIARQKEFFRLQHDNSPKEEI